MDDNNNPYGPPFVLSMHGPCAPRGPSTALTFTVIYVLMHANWWHAAPAFLERKTRVTFKLIAAVESP